MMNDIPTLDTLNSMRGLMTLYHLYMPVMRVREDREGVLKLPVRHEGCVNEALGMK